MDMLNGVRHTLVCIQGRISAFSFLQEFIGEQRAAQKDSLEANVGDLKMECEGIVADLRSPQYATFQQDVDTIVEDLEERVAHIQELVSASEKFHSYFEEFGMPEVSPHSVTAFSVQCAASNAVSSP